jgi:hypothetical protein
MGRKHHTNIHVGRGWGSTFPHSRIFPQRIKYPNGMVTTGSLPSRQESIKYKSVIGSPDVARYLGTSNFDCLIAKVTTHEYSKTLPNKVVYFGDSCPPSDNHGIRFCHVDYGPKTTINQKNRCITEALGKLQDGQTNLSESLATLGQTLGMVHGAWANLALSLLSFLRLNRKRFLFPARGAPGYRPVAGQPKPDWADLWLEYVYGHSTLLGDVMLALELLEKALEKSNTLSVDHSVTYRRSLEPTGRWVFTGDQQDIVRTKIVVDVKFPKLKVADQFGLLNPFQLAWELTPWSFALDWLVPVGSFIAGLTVPQLHSFRYGFTSELTITNIEGFEELNPLNGESGIKPHYVLQGLASRRRALIEIPLPRLFFRSPFTSPRRFVTALALLHAQLR